jgi:hypothetical protein
MVENMTLSVELTEELVYFKHNTQCPGLMV